MKKYNMAMTPEEQNRMNELERTVESLVNATNVPFIKNIERLSTFVTQETLDALKLSDLSDVESTDSALTGQVLKKTSTTWQPGTDNT